MASNETPDRYDLVVEHLEDAADGANSHGPTIGLKQNDEPALRAALTDLVGTPAGPGNVPPAVPGLKDKWNLAKAAKTAATGAVRSAVSNGRALARACIGVLKPRLGEKWTNAWQTAGFTNHSLAVPTNPDVLLGQIASYFSTNPTHEVPNLTPTISATAAACTATVATINAAETASNQSNANAGLAKKNLEAGIDKGRSRLSGLRNELTELLEPEDDLWYTFGFEKPSDPDTPEVPENVVVTAGSIGSKMFFVDWDDARRGTSYRVTVNDTATPPNKLAEVIVQESDATFALSALASGTEIAVVVSARNKKGGESGPSAPVSGTVP